MKNVDQTIGMFCALLAFVNLAMVFVNFSWSWPWLLLVAWTLLISTWTINGWSNIEVGHKGLLLFLGERLTYVFSEGQRFAPWPFEIKTVDCRLKSQEIDQLTVLTKDNIPVSISGTLVSQIEDPNLYFNVDPLSIEKGINDTWGEIIRTQVITKDLEDVRKMYIEVGMQTQAALEDQATKMWGLRIIRIPVTIKPVNTEVTSDMELKARKKMQRDGQEIELQHFVDQVIKLMADPPIGAGLTREQAIEQVQISLGKASKNIDAKSFSVDPATTQMIAKIIERIK